MNKKIISLLIAIMLTIGVSSSIASTPEDFESLIIKTGEPTIGGESAIAVSVLWRIDDKMRYSGTGLTFINGSDTRKPDNAVSVATKMVTSIKESMMSQEPSWRGALVEQMTTAGGDKLAALKVNNKQGHSLNEFVIRDYSNQQSVSYEVKPSFSADGVAAAIDVVFTESADGSNPFLSAPKKKTEKKASGGGIDITIADRGTVTVETANLTTREIEEKLATALGGSGGYVSSSQIFEDVKDGTTRNVKPFDGREVQFKSLTGNSIKISVKDPSVSAVLKLKYPDENNTMMDDIPLPVIVLLLALVVGGIGYFYWKSQLNAEENGPEY